MLSRSLETRRNDCARRLDRLITLNVVQPLRRVIHHRTSWRLPILMYHSISAEPEQGVQAYYQINTSPEAFREQIGHLVRAGYATIDLPQMVELLRRPQTLTRKCVVITFDDGFRDFYTEAFPVLAEYHATATVFLPTAYIKSHRSSFWDKECLTWSEVRELRRAGIHFGSHTVNHPRLALLSPAELEREVQDSKRELEQQLGEPIHSFSHPYAFPQSNREYVQRLRGLLMEAGYSSCVTTQIGRVRPGGDPFRCERLPINSLDDPELFQSKLEGNYDWLALPQAASKRVKALLFGGRGRVPMRGGEAGNPAVERPVVQHETAVADTKISLEN